VIRSFAALIALLAILVVAGCGDDDSTSSDSANSGGTTTSADQECADVQAPEAKSDGGEVKPKAKLDPAKTYDVTFATSCGDFTVRLDVKGAPDTAASFASLARKGFYDNTVFHRIVPNFVIQGGDPTGSGMGGPGYKTVDKPPSTATYTRGVVSMAKSAAEAPGTSGSQFYVVTGANVGLPPEYALLGEVTDGYPTVEKIEKQAKPGTEEPKQPVVIESVTVEKE